MNVIHQLEEEQIAKLTEEKGIPDFGPGDTVRVNVRVIEGTRERVQAFEGVCIARKNAGLNSAFTVRKLSYGEGVERVFPLYSPRLEGIDVIRRGHVRRAKLYYLRGRTGKAARIAERTTGRVRKKDDVVIIEADADSAPATAAEAFENKDTIREAEAAAAEAKAKEAAAQKDAAAKAPKADKADAPKADKAEKSKDDSEKKED